MTSLDQALAAASEPAVVRAGSRRREWNAAEPDSIEALQVVYKIAERCNINCSYCYYFNMGDETPMLK